MQIPHSTVSRWLATGGLVVSAAIPLRAQAQIRWGDCDPAITSRARCGTLRVPENRSIAGGRTIEIAFSVLRATGTERAADPVLVLLGGPGDAASRRLAALANAHAAVNVMRDVVFADQRGVGRSSALPCTYGSDEDLQSYMDFLPSGAVRDCATATARVADPSHYRTADFVADLEDLRRALNVAQWNLHGVSYGTRVAHQYMARHPDAVRSAVLVAVVPPQLAMPEPFGKDADRALSMLLADCRADSACHAAFPNLAAEFDSVARRLERAAAQVHVRHPVTGARVAMSFTRAAFGEAVRATMYAPAGMRILPLAVHEAYQGAFDSLATAHIRRQRTVAREGWNGLYLAATCAEDVPRVNERAVREQHRRTILGDGRARQHVAACAMWPGKPMGDEWPASDRIRPPVLMIVGDADPVTPPYWAELALRRMDRGRVITVARGGHGFAGMSGTDCIGRLQATFYHTPDPGALDGGCVAGMRRLPFILAR